MNAQKPKLDDLEIILGGLSSAARTTKSEHSETKFTLAVNRQGFPISYVNIMLSTDLKTGLTSMLSMKQESTSHFSKRFEQRFVSSGVLKKKNADARTTIRVHEEDRSLTLDEAVDSLDAILGGV